MTDVPSDLNAEVTTDGTHGTVGGLGGTEHLPARWQRRATGEYKTRNSERKGSKALLISSPALEDGVSSLPDHGDDWAADHVVDQTSKESLAGEVGIVLLHEFTGGGPELHGDELVALR